MVWQASCQMHLEVRVLSQFFGTTFNKHSDRKETWEDGNGKDKKRLLDCYTPIKDSMVSLAYFKNLKSTNTISRFDSNDHCLGNPASSMFKSNKQSKYIYSAPHTEPFNVTSDIGPIMACRMFTTVNH